ncbi:hypothetical protein ACG7TL_007464 [Trametes sanguinea]
MAMITRTIDRLPPEILGEIFKLVHTMEAAHGTRIGCCDQEHVVRRPRSPDKLAEVCTRWRSAALETRELWCRIAVHRSEKWLELGLTRSGNKPLHVGLHHPTTSLASWSLLEGHTQRLRSLTVAWYECKGTQKLFWRLIRMVANMQLPLLEELSVDYSTFADYWPGGGVDERGWSFVLKGTRLPALRVLCLKDAWIPWDSSIFSQLRVLHIEGINLHTSKWLFLDEFLALLQGCPYLEYLDLSHAYFVRFPSTEATDPDSDLVVGFPALRYLRLGWDSVWLRPSAIFQMLAHFRLEPQTTVAIKSLYEPLCVSSRPRSFPRCTLRNLIPRNPTCLPILATATTLCLPSMEFDAPHDMRFMASKADDPHRGSLTVDLLKWHKCSDNPWPTCRCADDQLMDICTIFAQAPLQRLELGSDAFSVSGLSAAIRSLPHIRILEVSLKDPYSLEEVIEALATPADPTNLESETKRGVVLPKLRTLRMNTFNWHSKLLSNIAEHLDWRSKRGTELSQLHIEVRGRPQDEEGEIEHEFEHSAQLLRLQMFVVDPVLYVDIPSPSRRTANPPSFELI